MLGSGQESACEALPTLGEFPATHWSVVLAAGHSEVTGASQALEGLCRAYWPPLYAYVRRQGHGPDDAQDLTQEFFARLLVKRYLQHADPACGRFRTFLLTSLKHFLISDWRKGTRQKRGGGHTLLSMDAETAEQGYAAEPAEVLTPEGIYERRWAATLIERVLTLLRSEYAGAGKERLFEHLKDSLWGERSSSPYATLAAELGVTEGALKVSAHRLRQRCRELLRAEIAQTVARPEEIDEELHHLMAVFSG
jgi:RNA polymerase sigma-70 factor (ECF subfamily)